METHPQFDPNRQPNHLNTSTETRNIQDTALPGCDFGLAETLLRRWAAADDNVGPPAVEAVQFGAHVKRSMQFLSALDVFYCEIFKNVGIHAFLM